MIVVKQLKGKCVLLDEKLGKLLTSLVNEKFDKNWKFDLLEKVLSV